MLVAVIVTLLGACGQVGVLDPIAREEPERIQWASADIGNVAISGDVEVLEDTSRLVVRASGDDIWAEADSFHFVYIPFNGDVEIRARIDALEPTHDRAKAGVMIRSGLGAGAVHAMAGVTPSGQAQFVYRLQSGGLSDFEADPHPGYPAWVRLVRLGDAVTASYSTDGDQWVDLGTQAIAFDEDTYVGIAVTSRDPSRLGTAEVGGVRVTRADGGVVGPRPPGATPPEDGAVRTEWVCGSEPLAPRYAPTHFVAANGDDRNDGRSVTSPFRTLQRAANVVSAGDVVWVRGGVYRDPVTFSRSGTVDRPIVFESYPGECAILDGDGNQSTAQVRFDGANFNVFRNFVVRNSPAQGIWLARSNDNFIGHVRTHDNLLSGIQNYSGNRNRFVYFISHDNFDPPRGGNADGIGISSGSYNEISNCLTFRNSDDGIDTWKSLNSSVEYCIAFENGFQGGDGNGVKAGGGIVGNSIVRFNIAFGNKTQGFNYNSGSGIVFEHNTSVQNRYYGFIAGRSTVRNNLTFANVRREWQDDGGNVQATNSWNMGSPDPRFQSMDPRSPVFLALSGGSRAIGVGTPIGSGAVPDLGALPYGETVESVFGISLAEYFD